MHVEAPGDRPVGQALKDLARYVYRVAIGDGRIVAVTDTLVAFKARDSDSDGKQRTVWLEGAEFVRRFLLHVLPKGFRKVRYYGLYAPGQAAHALAIARELLPKPDDGGPTDLEKEAILLAVERRLNDPKRLDRSCPRCQKPLATQPLQALAAGPP